MTARTIPLGRLIIARSVLSSLAEGGYCGEIDFWGMRYGVEIHRVAGGVEVVVFETAGRPVVAAAYRQPAIDGEVAE